MSLLRRRPETVPAGAAAAIAEFWLWWPTVRDAFAASITDGARADVDELNRKVSAIADGLQWELCRGRSSRHGLVVTAAGSAELRATAARWLSAAPAPDETWSYLSSRSADPNVFTSMLEVGDVKLSLSDTRFTAEVDDDGRTVDVCAYHPEFGQLPDEVRAQVTYLCLDWLLGEDEVETWIGRVTWTTVEPPTTLAPADLATVVESVALDEDSWVVMQGRSDGHPIIATAQRPLRPARWPRFDTHVAVVLPYRTSNEGGLPTDRSLDALRAFEDSLTPQLGDDGVLVAHQTSNRRRMLHYYVDGESDLSTRLAEAVRTWGEGRGTAIASLDPSHRKVAHLA